MLVLFLVLFALFLSCFLFCFTQWKTLFPCNSGVFFRVMLVKREFVPFSCCMLLFMLLFLVLFVCNQTMKLHYFVFVLSAFFVVTRLCHYVVFWFASCGLDNFCCFVFIVCFNVIHSFQKRPKKDTANPPKNKTKNQKKDKHQLAQLCSQIVFLIWGVGYTIAFSWKPSKIVVSANLEKGQYAKNVKKVEPKICARLSQESVQACCPT